MPHPKNIMAIGKNNPKKKPQPGYSPKPARRALQITAAARRPSPSPSPSGSGSVSPRAAIRRR